MQTDLHHHRQNRKQKLNPVKEKIEHEISFPNVLRIDHVYKPKLTLDIAKVKPLEIDPYDTITEAELAAIIAGKPNPAALSEIDLKEIAEKPKTTNYHF